MLLRLPLLLLLRAMAAALLAGSCRCLGWLHLLWWLEGPFLAIRALLGTREPRCSCILCAWLQLLWLLLLFSCCRQLGLQQSSSPGLCSSRDSDAATSRSLKPATTTSRIGVRGQHLPSLLLLLPTPLCLVLLLLLLLLLSLLLLRLPSLTQVIWQQCCCPCLGCC
jgi:hypothetical protein